MAEKYGPGPRELFIMGRTAAQQALRSFEIHGPVLRGEGGQPLWPQPLMGSISHTRGLACAVVCHRERGRGLGIDIELEDRQFNLSIERKICTTSERLWALHDESLVRQRLLSLISAKEAIFKAFYPINGVYLGFEDVNLTPHPDGYLAELSKLAADGFKPGFQFKVLQQKKENYLLSSLFLP